MASILFVGVFLAAVFFMSILIVNSLFKPTQMTTPKLPPGKKGWPIIGESMLLVRNPQKFIQDRMTRHSSEIFQTSIAGQRMAVLCGPAGNKFVFSSTNSDKYFKPWLPKAIYKALLFESSYLASLLDDHSFLNLDSIHHYVSIMDSTAKHHVDRDWAPHSEVKVHPLAKEFTFALSCRLLMNFYDDQVKDFANVFFKVAQGIVSTPVDFPGTAFSGAVKGGKVIKEKVLEIIRQRRAELLLVTVEAATAVKTPDQDLLTRLLLSSDNKTGKSYTDKEIANKIVGYLLAAFYTTTTAITFVLGHLAEHPLVYDKVLKEQLEIAKTKEAGMLLNWADIQKMKYSWDVVCESMRLIPAATGGFREVKTDFTFAGFKIPKGWKVFWTVYSTNKNPKYYPNPEKFDPSRFDGSAPLPYTSVPFGGGPWMCSGKEYARMEILVFVHNIVTRFKLKKLNPNEKIIHNPGPLPLEGLPICLKPHHSTREAVKGYDE